ncbi:MAG: zinc ribbon domain-containing protein [Comamonadaceae bacterium]|nr:MAG: zinc ribbon domain-containing protein [Comamonadaceae bacterium]
MPSQAQYRCRNCGHRFEVTVLNADERREAERHRQPLYAIACPDCRRQDVRPGWE